jgi:hypothetical protein
VAQEVEYLPSKCEALYPELPTNKQTKNKSEIWCMHVIPEIERTRQEDMSQPGLHSKFQASLGYTIERLCIKKKKKKVNLKCKSKHLLTDHWVSIWKQSHGLNHFPNPQASAASSEAELRQGCKE